MIYVKYPQLSLDNDPDLINWNNTAAAQRNWGTLKKYLFKHLYEPYKKNDQDPKCWYTEMPQLDHFAQDVEHFRPKRSAVPLNAPQRKKITEAIGYPVPESPISSDYAWLEYNHINYRATSALPNRGGGKVDSFPVLIGTNRLKTPELPTSVDEYPLLLDPCTEHDASILMVLPSGAIQPKANQSQVSPAQLLDPPTHWQDDSFNFLRGWVSIIVYQLDNDHLIRGRQRVYKKIKTYIDRLERDLNLKLDNNIKDHLSDIKDAISMYSPFALAARCAVLSYDSQKAINDSVGQATGKLLHELLNTTIKMESSLK